MERGRRTTDGKKEARARAAHGVFKGRTRKPGSELAMAVWLTHSLTHYRYGQLQLERQTYGERGGIARILRMHAMPAPALLMVAAARASVCFLQVYSI